MTDYDLRPSEILLWGEEISSLPTEAYRYRQARILFNWALFPLAMFGIGIASKLGQNEGSLTLDDIWFVLFVSVLFTLVLKLGFELRRYSHGYPKGGLHRDVAQYLTNERLVFTYRQEVNSIDVDKIRSAESHMLFGGNITQVSTDDLSAFVYSYDTKNLLTALHAILPSKVNMFQLTNRLPN